MTEEHASLDDGRWPLPGKAILSETAAINDSGRQPGEAIYGLNPMRAFAVDPQSIPRPARDIWIRRQILKGIEKRAQRRQGRADPSIQIANLKRILMLKKRGPV